MIRKTALSAILLISTSCLSACSNTAFDRAQVAAEAKVKNLTITCTDTVDCPVKWARALQWVTDHAPYKLRIANDTAITTEGPIDDVVYSLDSAITVTKVPRGDGTSVISFKSACANEFG